MLTKLYLPLLLLLLNFQLSRSLININYDERQLLMLLEFLNENIRNSEKNFFLIYDGLSKDIATKILCGLNENVSYIIRDCNREKILIEDALIIMIINSEKNNYHLDCFKYTLIDRSKMIVIDTYVLSIESFAYILRYFHYGNDDNIFGMYESNGSIVSLKYDNHLNEIRANKLNYPCKLIIDVQSKNMNGKILRVFIMDVTNELMIGNDILKYDDDNLLENAISSLNGTIEYLKWEDIDYVNELNEWIVKRYQFFVIISKQDTQLLKDLYQKTYPYEMDYLGLIVPKSRPLTLNESILMINSPIVWLIYATYDKIFGSIWSLIRIITKQSCKILYCYSHNILFGDPFYTRVKKTAMESLLMLAMVWFTFFALSTFQVLIISTMASLKFTHQIQSLNEICKSSESIEILFTFEQNIKSIIDIYGTSCNKLTHMIQPINSINPSLFISELFLNANNNANRTAFILDQNHAKLIATSRFNRAQGLPLYFVTSDRLLPRFKSYYIRKTSRYYNVINKRIIYLYESGFQIYWSEQMRHKYRLKGLLYPNDYVDTDVLTKSNVLKMLLFLLTCYIFAFVHVILEISWKRFELWLVNRNVKIDFMTKWLDKYK